MAETGAPMPYDYDIFAGISGHVTSFSLVPLRRSDLSWSEIPLETLHARILGEHCMHCLLPSKEHRATGRIWSHPNLTSNQVARNLSLLEDYQPSDFAKALNINRDGKSFVSDHIPAFQPPTMVTHGDYPFAFIVEIVPAHPKRLASADIGNTRPTKQQKTSVVKVLPVQRIGESRVLKTPGSRLQLPPRSRDFPSLFTLPACLITDGTSAIAALEDHAKTRTQDGFWGCTVHIPTSFPRHAWLTSVAEFYNLLPRIPYEDSYAHCDIAKRPDLASLFQSSLVLVLDLSSVKPQDDFKGVYADITHILRTQLVSFLQYYSEGFFSNAMLDLNNLEAHEALEAVLELVKKHRLTVFLGFLEYDLLALETWMDYTLGLLPSLPPLDVIYPAKTCFLRIHNVIQVYRRGPNPTITRALYVGSSNSFAYALGSSLDLEDMPELASSVAMTAQDVEACLRMCLPSSRHSEVGDYLKTIKNIAGGYCFSADAPPDCRNLFRPEDVLSCLTLVQKSKDITRLVALSDRQHDYHAQLRVLKSVLHISSTEDRNEVVSLIVGHVIEMDDTTLRYNVDVPVQRAAADDTNAAFRQYLGSTNQAAQKLMVTLGLVTFQPEESDGTGVSAWAIPNDALSNKESDSLSADLRADAVTSEHLTKFDGTKQWFTDLLSTWSARRRDSIRTIEKIPEAVLQNTLELYVNMSSGITVSGPTPDRAIQEVQLIADKSAKGEVWRNFADIFVLPRAQEKGETDAEFLKDPTHLLLFVIELKSLQLYFLFWGTFGRTPTASDLVKFRDRLLEISEASWQALIDNLDPVAPDLSPHQYARRQDEREKARPKFDSCKDFLKWGGGACALTVEDLHIKMLTHRVSVRDFLLEARDQYYRYSNIAEKGTDNRQKQYIDDVRVRCDDNNALKHRIKPMSIVLVGGLIPLVDDSAPVRETIHHYSR